MQKDNNRQTVFRIVFKAPDHSSSRTIMGVIFFVFLEIFFLCNYVSADDRIVTFYTKGMQRLCSVRAELAVTPEEHERGLMYRKSLATDAGMLFVFKEDSVQFFWMKNTHIPLDMVFINSKLEVTGIYRSAKPFDEKTVTSWSPATYVLEINAGKADQCDIKVGSKIKFKHNLKSHND